MTPVSDVIAKGTFTGKSGHKTSGGVSLRRTKEGLIVVLSSDFLFDGAPDAKVALGNDRFESSAILSALRSDRGFQEYLVPDSLLAGENNEVWI